MMNRKSSSERLKEIPVSIFSVMSKLAVEHNAVNLGQGFPDFDGPEWIMEAAFNAMKQGKNQYAPSIGVLGLRKIISSVQKKYYFLDWNFDDEITITAGATEGIFCTINALIGEGDEVILFEPFYDAYQADVIISGAIPKYVTLHKPDFHFDIDELENSITPNTKMIILNNPHNPTGKVFNYDELKAISDIAIKFDLLVLSDEVYEFLTYDDNVHIPISTLPGMKERTITISSSGKTFSLTGWKIGFVLAVSELSNAIRNVHQWTTFAVNTPSQHAIAYAFSQLESYLPEFKRFYHSKRNLIYYELLKTSFKPIKPSGSYFIMVEIPEFSKIDDVQLAMELVKNFGVATVPPSFFYGKSDEGKTMLRLCFAKSDETIISGISNLKNFHR